MLRKFFSLLANKPSESEVQIGPCSEALVRPDAAAHLSEAAVGRRRDADKQSQQSRTNPSAFATCDMVTDGARSDVPMEISSEEETSEDRLEMRRQKSEAQAEAVDVVDSDDDHAPFSRKHDSKKENKERKKRRLVDEDDSDDEPAPSSNKKLLKQETKEMKRRLLEKKQQNQLLEKELKEIKKRRKMEKRVDSEKVRKKKKKQRNQLLEKELEEAKNRKKLEKQLQAAREALGSMRAKTAKISQDNAKKQLTPLRPKTPPKAEAASLSSPPLTTDPQTEVLASDPIPRDENATHGAEMPVAPETPEEPDASNSDKGNSASSRAHHTNPGKVAEPASCFANFGSFDAQAAHSRAHPVEKIPEVVASWRKPTKPQKIRLPEELFSLQHLPEELKLEGELDDDPALYVAHFVRWALGAWQRSLNSGEECPSARLTQETAIFRDRAKLQKTTSAVAPLLRQLRSKEIPEEVVKQLLSIVRLAAKRSYASAFSEYVDITMGKKTWHQSMTQSMQQQAHGGSICRIIKQSPLVDFDWNPVVQEYMRALSRLMKFAQCVRPPEFFSDRA